MPPEPRAGRDIVLVTRPEADFSGTSDALAALGFTALSCPCQRVVPRPPTVPPGAAQAVLLTSRNAARALAGLPAWQVLPAFCVGDATRAAAHAAGWGQAVSADGDARALARLVRRQLHPRDGALLLATARGAGHTLASLLRTENYRVRRRVVYAMRPLASLPDAARAALMAGRVAAVLFHAGGAARLFTRAIKLAGLAHCLPDVEAFTISKSAAASLASTPGDHAWRRILWPTRPNEAAMLALLPKPRPPQAGQSRRRPPEARPARVPQLPPTRGRT